MPAGTSRLLRVVSSEDLISPGLTPTASFSPGPVTVNYILVGTARDLTISITVPPDTAPGPQTLEITDGPLTHSVAEALWIVDGTILNPSPSVLSLNSSAILSIAAHPLFSGQSSFSLDLGPDVSVGPATLQPDGTLQAPVSVSPSAIPGTRSVHLTAGPYTFLAERGFAIDYGPLVNRVQLHIEGPYVWDMDLQLPNGYTASIFALPTAENGLGAPDDMYVDDSNTLYVLNRGAFVGPAPFSILVFDLNPSNFGALKGVFRDIDPSGRGGLIESPTMLPSRPGMLYFSTEDFPSAGFGGGRTINELDTATGNTRLFWFDPYWQLDPIATDVNGNMAVCDDNELLHRPEISLLDPDGNLLKTCVLDAWSDTLRLDPLTGKFLINRPSPGGTQMVDLSTCARVLRSDSLGVDDEGRFAPGGGDFGNQYFSPIPAWSAGIATQVPVPYTDPDQSVPERAVKFLSGVPLADGTSFDRDGKNLVVTDRYTGALITIHRIPGYAAPSPAVSLSPTNLTFGDQQLGTTSAPHQVATLSNTGSAILTIASIAATGDFTQSNTCGSEVTAGGNCTISVSFTPMAPGGRSGSIVITDSALSQPHVVSLTGTGIGPAVTLSSASLDLGNQRVGTTSTAQAVTLSNTGNMPLTIISVTASGDFAQTNTCGNSVAAGGSCTISVTFTPTAAGTRNGAITINDDSLDSPQVVTLAGVGQDFSVGSYITERTVVAGAATTFSVKLTPQGGFAQSVLLACSGAPPAATCVVSPGSVVLDGTSAALATVTATTTARSVGVPRADGLSDPPSPDVWGRHSALQQLLWLLGSTMLGSLAALGRQRRLGLSLTLTMLLALLWVACGGGGGSRLPRGTPAGTYTLTVTAATSDGLSRMGKVALTVN